jgi:CheY-like chemotaxis protein
LPGFDGFDLCRQIGGLAPHSPILFYSSAAHDADFREDAEQEFGRFKLFSSFQFYGQLCTS